MISVIIPTYNEASTIAQTLAHTLAVAQSAIEIIVVDGGSQDETVAIAAAYPCQVMTATTGRATQMNRGASIAQGDSLLFLHADTELPNHFDVWVQETLAKPDVMAGAFELAIAGTDHGLRWVEWGVKWRSHLCQLPYGDQALFIKTNTFHQVGGFPDLPIMEDFVWVQQLKRLGKIAIAPVPVQTSARRWQKLGIWKTTGMNQLIILGYFLGISTERLRILYRKFC
ncbi:MAG: TIGR04283 family arsenosugar biosynthesis glycosyltransferase [Synechococcales bacterium]|nr:TIGR04283 family arsenosugar biosynthesis glycosyltransferase [Synechococcales bacterium]